MQEQLDEYFKNLLSKFQCGFRQNYGAQNCLLSMIEKVRNIGDKKIIFAVVLSDFLKPLNCIFHNLLKAKFSVCVLIGNH